ncbi:hypothetical protein [Urechidicola croceus]|uniref:Lipoprotein n=1 Tax=Urechidicola croceus TaxID=1850246 RepID=A0A1D8P6C5_9FLAO|nr:hypothetical protein [Urechidicola croceus]AOW20121.1 hypothetical protein LPB138_05245 [Urechidicola croceus]
MKLRITLLLLIAIVFTSCNKDENKKRGRFDFSKVKTELNLTPVQAEKFDAIIATHQKIREESFAAAKEGGKMDRSAMMNKMQDLMKVQNEEVLTILNQEQTKIYNAFAKKMARFGKSGYTDEFVTELNTKLELNEQQSKMLTAVNKAFEKSYSNAHDYYHGNADAAKEYWNKFDEERQNALKQVFSEEQFTKYLELAKEHAFQGEHGGK